ncbi:hypothetical protein EJ065_1650 [Corallococcus coralloides]|uniref:Uncharacterized protein n=2 Tax=Corallococcus coralloides TaxID=184914 RepID=A0A410RMU3_CORCK|nr:hypothetical protein EJ065_1650 [Corallococcus coralloides]
MTLVPYSFQSGAADAFWPGGTYVDWVGADAYNWNGCNPMAGDTSMVGGLLGVQRGRLSCIG